MKNFVSYFGFILGLLATVNSRAADGYIEKLRCSGSYFYGANVQTSREQGVLATYTPAEVNGTSCRLHPRTKLPVTASTCMNFHHESTNIKISDCVIGLEASDESDGYEHYFF